MSVVLPENQAIEMENHKFHSALLCGDLELFERGLSAGCDPCSAESALFLVGAVGRGHLALVDRCVSEITRRSEGRSPALGGAVHAATSHGNVLMLNLLHKHGAQPRKGDRDRDPNLFQLSHPLWEAVDKSRIAALNWLISHGYTASPHEDMLFCRAAVKGDGDVFKALESHFGLDSSNLLVAYHAVLGSLHLYDKEWPKQLEMVVYLAGKPDVPRETICSSLKRLVKFHNVSAVYALLDVLRERFKTGVDNVPVNAALLMELDDVMQSSSETGLLLRQAPEWSNDEPHPSLYPADYGYTPQVPPDGERDTFRRKPR